LLSSYWKIKTQAERRKTSFYYNINEHEATSCHDKGKSPIHRGLWPQGHLDLWDFPGNVATRIHQAALLRWNHDHLLPQSSNSDLTQLKQFALESLSRILAAHSVFNAVYMNWGKNHLNETVYVLL
jgi:hypothetical protein